MFILLRCARHGPRSVRSRGPDRSAGFCAGEIIPDRYWGDILEIRIACIPAREMMPVGRL